MDNKHIEEKPREEVAKEVITPTHLYFVPGISGEIKARDLHDVRQIVKKKREVKKDGNS